MHVGMNRVSVNGAGPFHRVPHARGDEPLLYRYQGGRFASSPCTWG